jgi:hypothetical protein
LFARNILPDHSAPGELSIVCVENAVPPGVIGRGA